MQAGIILSQGDVDNMVGGIARHVAQLLVTRVPLVQAKIAAEATALGSAMEELNDLDGVFVGAKPIASGGAVSSGSGHDFRPYIGVVGGLGF